MQTEHLTKSTRHTKADTDIVGLILEDHKPLKELIETMKDLDQDQNQRFGAFDEFATALIAHAHPEEEILYSYLKKNEDLKEKGYESEVEHRLADQLVEEIKRTTNPDIKSAKIKVLAELVEHHIEEEENELLPEFKKEIKKDIRLDLGNEFLKLKLQYLAADSDMELNSEDSSQETATH